MKKFWIYLCIAIATILFACTSLFVILVLAPGVELFGIKYISYAVGDYSETQRITFVSQDIYLYTYDVPVEITFAKEGTLGIEYVQQFQGYTRAKDEPNITIKNKDGELFNIDQDDQAHIYINQYKKFIWNNDSKDFYLRINLPAEYKNNGTIFVQSTNSKVSIDGAKKTIKTLKISTDNKIEIKNDLTVQDVQVETKQNLLLGENVNIQPIEDSGVANLSVKIQNEGLIVENEVKNGDINFETSSGNLTFNSCRNLTVKNSSGNINKSGGGTVNGNLNFQTTSGSININNIYGQSHTISSTSGRVNIQNCSGTLKIVTNRSNIVLGTIHSAEISTTTGDISVEKVLGSINATSTRSGDITCGSVKGSATLETYDGDITVSGVVDQDLKMTARNGQFKLVSAQNLSATVKEGSIVGYEHAQIEINGVADISCEKGDIEIGSIKGTSEGDQVDNTIYCKSGSLKIGTVVGSISISSYNAPITIEKTGKIEIEASSSSIKILCATNGVDIQSISGDVVLGSDIDQTQTINNASCITKTGSIYAYNTTGDVYLFSNKMVTLINLSSKKIFINTTKSGDTSGKDVATGKVVATKLDGQVRVCSEDDVKLQFSNISDNVRVDTSGSCKNVEIDASSISQSQVGYLLQSSKGVENILCVGDIQNVVEKSAKIQSSNDATYTIKVFTTAGKTQLLLGA